MIPPYLVAAVICDVGVTDPSSGKKSLIGLFTRVHVHSFPAARPMTLYVKISDAKGYYPLEVEFVHLNTNLVTAKMTAEIQVDDRKEYADFLIDFPPLSMPAPGRYEFRIKASGMFVGNTFLDAINQSATVEER